MDPLQWWDHRSEKINARHPDFKHKRTKDALWIDAPSTPCWVCTELANLRPGSIQESLFSWNSRILKLVKDGEFGAALEIFQQMRRKGVHPDVFSLTWAIKACSGLKSLEVGRLIHSNAIESQCEGDFCVESSLINMYVECGAITDAWDVFSKSLTCHLVSWNAMICGFVKCGSYKCALDLFHKMELANLEPDGVTLVGVFNACAGLSALAEGRDIHSQIHEKGWSLDIFVQNALINMYGKCGNAEEAWRVFAAMPTHDLVSWNSMIVACANCKQWERVLSLFQQMNCEKIEHDKLTLILALKSCLASMLVEEGRCVHSQVFQAHCDADVFVGSCLINMYAKFDSLEDACGAFNQMNEHDTVLWNSMLIGYVELGQYEKALVLFAQMQRELIPPDTATFLIVLNACASLGAVEEGCRVHVQIIQMGFEVDVCIANCLVDMYAKCGNLEYACKVFNNIRLRNRVSWNCMIHGYAKSGQPNEALRALRLMQHEGMAADCITFMGVLSACASGALLKDGRRIHEQIVQSGLLSDVSLGNCLINMYAKCGSLEDAQRAFNSMETHNVMSWTSMLSAYAKHGLGKEAVRLFEQMHKQGFHTDQAVFICLLSACSHSGLLDEGSYYFECSTGVYGIMRNNEIYSCIVDLFGRAGLLRTAEDLIKGMWCEPTLSVWMALLGACRLHNNVEMGERTAKQVMKCYPQNSSSYILLSHMHSSTLGNGLNSYELAVSL